MFKDALVEMFETFRIHEPKTLDRYYKKLKKSGLCEYTIKDRIEKLCLVWKPEYGKKIPSLSEIIGLDVESKDVADVENAWQEFKKTACNNYRFETIPDWVFTIKTLIGISDVEDMTLDTEKWVKKEFLRIFPSVKNGLIKLQKDKNKYITNGNITLKLDEAKEFLPELLPKPMELLEGKQELLL
jgi:hypothetical protein